MTSSNETKTTLAQILQQLSQQYLNQYQQVHAHLPIIDHDDEWPSPCEVDNEEGDNVLANGQVFWRPVDITDTDQLTFNNVESVLGITLHLDIKSYFTSLYSESLDMSCQEGALSLLFAWNKDDFDRLQENVIGHILMKQRLKQKITVFFAVTDEEDMIISIDNDYGSVWVERVGCEPHKKLADSLTDFLSELSPSVHSA